MAARDVFVKLYSDAVTGVEPSADAKIRFVPTRLRDAVDGEVLTDGIPRTPVPAEGLTVTLETTGLDWAYFAEYTYPVHHASRAGTKSWYVQVPDGTEPINFKDLPKVDPKTLTPVNNPDPAWVDAVVTAFADAVPAEIAAQIPTAMVTEIQTPGPVQDALNAAFAGAFVDNGDGTYTLGA